VSIHSCVIAPHLKDEFSSGETGKYGKMFAGLPGLETDDTYLLALGREGSLMDVDAHQEGNAISDNPRIPAGFPIFGQFIAHDITADRSLLLHHARLEELRNFRTPRLDLECLYAAGPSGDPYLYDLNDLDKFLLGINEEGEFNDLPRNRQGRALVGDPRNDVHLIISQLHLAFLKFHNRVVDLLREQGTPAGNVFKESRRLVRWHYQWIVAHEFLPLSVGDALMSDLLENGPRFYSFVADPFIPVEFADAAYRFGHSQIRNRYTLNALGASGNVFPDCAGTCPVQHERVIDWRYFFAVDNQHTPRASKKIDTSLANALMHLPKSVVGETEYPEQHSLAYRDLERGLALNFPSGEAIAHYMGTEPLGVDDVGLNKLGYQGETPLFYYILKEAEVRNNGHFLGEVGGRIVAEVLLGLLDGDPTSYRNADTAWTPTLPGAHEGDFTLADLLRFADVA
jgi:Animal haem peroxidase